MNLEAPSCLLTHHVPCRQAFLVNRAGNVGRFINHSCDGNLVVQPTFVQGSSSLHYRVAMFATRKILAYEELTYK